MGTRSLAAVRCESCDTHRVTSPGPSPTWDHPPVLALKCGPLGLQHPVVQTHCRFFLVLSQRRGEKVVSEAETGVSWPKSEGPQCGRRQLPARPDVDAAVNRSGKHRAATLQNRLGELLFEARGSGSVELVGAQGWCV